MPNEAPVHHGIPIQRGSALNGGHTLIFVLVRENKKYTFELGDRYGLHVPDRRALRAAPWIAFVEMRF